MRLFTFRTGGPHGVLLTQAFAKKHALARRKPVGPYDIPRISHSYSFIIPSSSIVVESRVVSELTHEPLFQPDLQPVLLSSFLCCYGSGFDTSID